VSEFYSLEQLCDNSIHYELYRVIALNEDYDIYRCSNCEQAIRADKSVIYQRYEPSDPFNPDTCDILWRLQTSVLAEMVKDLEPSGVK